MFRVNIKKLVVIGIMMLPAIAAFSQVLKIDINNDGEVSLSPTSEFIKQKNIRKIEFDYSTKLPNQIIKRSPDRRTDEFTADGYLKQTQGEKHIAGRSVAFHVSHSYNDDRLESTLEKDHIGYFRTFFTYAGDTTFKTSYRASHYDPKANTHPTERDSTFINSSFTVSLSDQVRHFNKNGLHIKTSAFSTDSLGLLKTESTSYTLSTQKIHKEYLYNKEGFISELKLVNTNTESIFNYYYDHTNVLERIEIWKGNENTLAIELVYDANGWLDAIIHQNPANNHIRITELTYKIN